MAGLGVKWTPLLFLCSALLRSFTHAVENPEDFVNLLAGSFTDGQRFSTGNTLPLVGRPWGFNHWAPQTTNGRSSWWFSGNDHQFRWLRCTHQPSPWIGDYAWFMVGPQMGGMTSDPVGFWEPRGATIKPHYFDATTGPDGMRIELVPSMHGAMIRVTFPSFNPYNNDKRICFKNEDGSWDSRKMDDGRGALSGSTGRVNGNAHGFRHYIRAVSDEIVDRMDSAHGITCFSYPKNQVKATVRIATSFISMEQAEISFNREIAPNKHPDLDSLFDEAKEEWRGLLNRVEVVDPGDIAEDTTRHLTVFYTGLYRALTFPRRLDEIDANGNMVHFSPYGGGVRNGPLVTDNGFWDTFRTVYPLLGLLYPDLLGDIIQGWLNAFKEGGWLPGWASPGYRESMVGTYGDVVVADAIIKKIPNFEIPTAWEAIHKDSFQDEPGGHMGVGKAGLRHYDQYKYIPNDVGVSEMVSRSLDFAFADVAVANAAFFLAKQSSSFGHTERFEADGNKLKERGLAVQRNLYDSSSGLMRPKSRNGHFDSNFVPNRWGGGYTEGSAWHHSFPSYAVTELALIHGGKPKLLRKLHELLETPGTFQVGGYGQEIHEMTEMRAVAMGQYGHNNQPCHHILYLFALLGEHSTTAETVRHVMNHAYGVDFYAGDEDNGEQGAWFVLSALGLYSVAPGVTDEYVMGSPLFKHVTIHYPPRSAVPELKAEAKPSRELHVVAAGTGKDSYLVREFLWNDQPVEGATVSDAVIQNGGTLRFVMSSEPSPLEAYDVTSKPYDSSKHVTTGAASGDSSGSSLVAYSAPSGSDSTEAEQRAAKAIADLEEYKRSSVALTGSLQEQIETYSTAAETAAAEAAQLKEELMVEKQARSTETTSLQAAIQDQSREIKALEAKIELVTSSAMSSKESSSGTSEQELSHLKALLENEISERKRTTILLNMLQDHNQRLTALSDASASAQASGSAPFVKSGALPSDNSTMPLLQYVSYLGFFMAVVGCAWTLASGSSSSAPSRYRKETSHIV